MSNDMNKNADTVYNFFKSKGLNDNQTFAIMGNIQQESSFNSKATNKSSGAFGIFQWLGNRKTNLQNYALEKGTTSSNLNTQLDFAWYELTTSEKATLKALEENENASVETLTELFEKKFERSGGSALTERKNYAKEWASHYSNGTSVSSSNDKVDLSLGGNVVKVVTILLLIVLTVVFLMLTIKGGVKNGK